MVSGRVEIRDGAFVADTGRFGDDKIDVIGRLVVVAGGAVDGVTASATDLSFGHR